MSSTEVVGNMGETLVPRKRKVELTLAIAVIFVSMFVAAGTFVWKNGWILWSIGALSTWIGYRYLKRVNPEVIVARSVNHEGTKTWDKWLLGIIAPLFLAGFIIAPLDTKRFEFWPLPDSLIWPGILLFVLGFWLTLWAEGANKFFEPTVRIQTERGHYVVTTGPYAIVRHPGYVGAIAISFGCALILGSGLAVTISTLVSIVFVFRTALEDQTLVNELPGYQEYTEKVRYRLIPGVW